MKKDENQTSMSRRGVLAGAGALAAAAALAKLGDFSAAAWAKDGSTEKWPWPYEKLDPARTADIAYEEWYRVFCGAAVINSVFSQLREKVGEPYKSFPADAFVFLEGGMLGWGTVCGSNAGACIVSSLIVGPRIAGSDIGHQIGGDMMQWYSQASMPVYSPAKPKTPGVIVKTTSNSPLCHQSVGRWMKASGKALASAERKDRCARVAASVAYHLVEDLNAWKDGKFVASKDTISCAKEFGITGQPNCGACHGDKVPTPPMAKKS